MFSSPYHKHSEKVSFKNQSVTVAGLAVLCGVTFLPSSEIELKQSSIKPISDVSHSTQDFFSAYAKDYSFLVMRLDEIKSLEDNWNGYGAAPIDPQIIFKARKFLAQVKDLSSYISIFPTARQSIQIEWKKDDKYCEAEIFADSIEIYAEKNDVEQIDSQFQTIEQAVIAFRKAFNA